MGIQYDALKQVFTIGNTNNTRDKMLTLRYTTTPLSIRLAGSTVYSLQFVSYITAVGHYRVVGCTGETVLTICGSTKFFTVNSWGQNRSYNAF